MEGENDQWMLRRRKKIIALMAIMVAIAVIVPSITFVTVRQIQDYHDAKYRAQYQIVSEMPRLIGETGTQLFDFTDNRSNYSLRIVGGNSASFNFRHLGSSATALRAMYLDDDEKLGPLTQLAGAFDGMYRLVGGATRDLIYPGAIKAASLDAIDSCWPALNDIESVLRGSIKEGVSGYEHPYSLVNRMNLTSISASSMEIIQLTEDY